MQRAVCLDVDNFFYFLAKDNFSDCFHRDLPCESGVFR
ncbi:hypothetical protein SGB_04129 [Shigella boydii ATCC 9905]|nr:hypothetical protein SGB_04129 [Shigella boydii ATCC 9905]